MRHDIVAIGLAAILSAAPAQARPMPEFRAIAARGGEQIEMTGVPSWTKGRFRIGADGTTGTVDRTALGRSREAGFRGGGMVASDGDVWRYGRMRFEVRGPAVGGTLAGSCGYDRSEARATIGGVVAARPVLPLALDCDFARDGRAIGTLRIDGVVPGGAIPRAERTGEVRVGDTVLGIRSLHRTGGLGVKAETPLGYAFTGPAGDIGAIDLSGFTTRRLSLPSEPGARDAVLAAGIALGLFWDPGDTDD